jgi:hypothetical protein
MNEQPQKQGITKLQLMLVAILFLVVLYLFQKSGCSLTRTEEKLEWIDHR